MVSPYAEAQVEVRYKSEKELERIKRTVEKIASRPYVSGTEVEFEVIDEIPPLVLNENTKVLMDYLTGLIPGYLMAGGLSDANQIAPSGIAIIDGCGPGGGQPHSEREFLAIDTVPERFYDMRNVLLKAWELYKNS